MVTILIVILLVLALGGGFWRRAQKHQEVLREARQAAKKLTAQQQEATRQAVQEYQQKSHQETEQYRMTISQELDDDQRDNQRKGAWIEQRMKLLEQKRNALANRANLLSQKRHELQDRKNTVKETLKQADQLITERWQTLQNVADLPEEQARDVVLQATKEDAEQSQEEFVNNAATELESSKEREAEIIGNSGQNVRAIEALTGVDVIIDDQTKEVIINGYDPVRRATAMEVIKSIKGEKRVLPDTIERLVNQANRTIDERIRHYGENAVRELELKHVAPDLIKIIGRMHYRTSYGQNILEHSIETAKLAGIFATELGENAALARRAGLLHDIGKSIDRDIEATHVELGVELTTKFRENPVVINTIASHHGDVESKYVIADLVEAADAISGARQGARSESAADYLQRIKSLEGIANDQPEVQESYAIQAGRELRVIVLPKETNDRSIKNVATNVKDRIEDEVTYPGQVKVTVVRKLEIVEYAEKKQA